MHSVRVSRPGGDRIPHASRPARGRAHPHAFGTSPEYTVGVEEEFMVLDADTLGLTPRADEIIDAAGDENIKQEIRQSMVEISSKTATTIRDLHRDLHDLRLRATTLAYERGLRVAAAGTHPFSPAETQDLTDKPRYRYVAGISGWVGRRATAVFGTHVHVALGSPEKALGVVEAMLNDLPTLVALSASSPLWEGQDTGFASARLAVRAELPRTGLPPSFDSLAHYRSTLESLRTSGLVPDASYLWWDVRLQDRLGTIEVRLLDAQPSLHDTVALAGLVQALVRHHGARWDAGIRPAADRMITDENRWQALRHGMSATFASPRGRATTAREAVDELLGRVADEAGASGSRWALDHLADLAARGGRATDLRDRFLLSDDPRAVTRHLVHLGERDLITPIDLDSELVSG